MNMPPRAGTGPQERSLGELFRELSEESSRLVRQELALARAEMRQSVRELRKDAMGVVLGGVTAAVGGLVLVAFLVTLLGELLGGSYWLAALIVAVLLLGVGGWMAMRAMRRMRTAGLAPRQTISSLRTTQSWAGEQAAELRAVLAEGQAAGDGAHRAPLHPPRHAAPPANRIREHLAAPTPDARPSSRGGGGGEASGGGGGVKGLMATVAREIRDDDITGHAAKLAYYAFMSIPPALMATFGLAGLFGGVDLARTIQTQARLALPPSVNEAIITPFIEQVVLDKAPGPFSIGIVLALWGASSLFAGLMSTLNAAYDVEEDRPFLKQRAIAIATMVAGALLFLVAAVTLLGGPGLASAVGLGTYASTVWTIVQWPLAYAFIVAAFWLVYYVLPNRDQSACKRVLVKAAAAAALLWVIATTAFRIYIVNFSSYNETYGFLGAFIIFLLWLYMTGLVVLAGGELAAEMERR